jgi:hypothetical protein
VRKLGRVLRVARALCWCVASAPLHSSPNVTFQGCCCSPVAVARRAWMCVDEVWRASWRCCSHIPGSMHGRVRLLVQPSTRTSQQHRISANLLARRAPLSPILDNNTPAPQCSRAVVACCLSPPPLTLRFAFCVAVAAAVVGSSQLLLPRQSSIRTPAGASETPS